MGEKHTLRRINLLGLPLQPCCEGVLCGPYGSKRSAVDGALWYEAMAISPNHMKLKEVSLSVCPTMAQYLIMQLVAVDCHERWDTTITNYQGEALHPRSPNSLELSPKRLDELKLSTLSHPPNVQNIPISLEGEALKTKPSVDSMSGESPTSCSDIEWGEEDSGYESELDDGYGMETVREQFAADRQNMETVPEQFAADQPEKMRNENETLATTNLPNDSVEAPNQSSEMAPPDSPVKLDEPCQIKLDQLMPQDSMQMRALQQQDLLYNCPHPVKPSHCSP